MIVRIENYKTHDRTEFKKMSNTSDWTEVNNEVDCELTQMTMDLLGKQIRKGGEVKMQEMQLE
jgi:hypothetical protein